MRTAFFYALTLLGGLWLQVIENHFLGESIFSVQFLIIAVIYEGLTHGPVVGPLVGFCWGMLSDAASLGLLGERALLFCAVGFIAGSLRRQLDDTKPWTQGIFALTASLGIVLGEMFIEHVFLHSQRSPRISTWLQPLWNGLAAPLVFIALRAWDVAWGSREVHR